MGKKLVVKGADFSENAIPLTLEEQLIALLNSNVQSTGFRESTSSSDTPTNIYKAKYSTQYSKNRCCIDNGGLDISEITALGITSFKVTLLNDYRGAFVIGNSEESIFNMRGSFDFYSTEFTVDFENHNGTNWLEKTGTIYILMEAVQKASATSEVLELDFGKYFQFEVLNS